MFFYFLLNHFPLLEVNQNCCGRCLESHLCFNETFNFPTSEIWTHSFLSVSSQPYTDGRSGVLHMIAEKVRISYFKIFLSRNHNRNYTFWRFLMPSYEFPRRQVMEENQLAPAARHPVMQVHLQLEQAIPWFMTCSSFIKWSFFHPSLEPSFQINLASPLPLLFEH